MNRSLLQDSLARKVGGCLGFGSALWVYVLIKGALTLRDQSGSIYYDVHIGPLLLNELSKQQLIDGGYVIDFSFESGMVWYVVICCCIGVAWGCFSSFLHHRRGPLKE